MSLAVGELLFLHAGILPPAVSIMTPVCTQGGLAGQVEPEAGRVP